MNKPADRGQIRRACCALVCLHVDLRKRQGAYEYSKPNVSVADHSNYVDGYLTCALQIGSIDKAEYDAAIDCLAGDRQLLDKDCWWNPSAGVPITIPREAD